MRLGTFEPASHHFAAFQQFPTYVFILAFTEVPHLECHLDQGAQNIQFQVDLLQRFPFCLAVDGLYYQFQNLQADVVYLLSQRIAQMLGKSLSTLHDPGHGVQPFHIEGIIILLAQVLLLAIA